MMGSWKHFSKHEALGRRTDCWCTDVAQVFNLYTQRLKCKPQYLHAQFNVLCLNGTGLLSFIKLIYLYNVELVSFYHTLGQKKNCI